MLETTAIVNFLLLRLKRSLYEPLMNDVPAPHRAMVAGAIEFAGFRGVDVLGGGG